MAKITKPDMTNIWAEIGNVAAVPSEKISEGWVVEIPPYEEANFVENRQDIGLAYILQQGIPEWDSLTEYQPTSYVQYSGVVYRSVGVNLNKTPLAFPALWTKAFDDFGAANGVLEAFNALVNAPDPFTQYLLKVRATANGIDADLAVTNQLTSVNLDVVRGVGEYWIGAGNANVPPSGDFSLLKVWRANDGNTGQLVQANNGHLHTRFYSTGGWTPWMTTVSSTELSASTTGLQAQLNALSDRIEAMKVKVGALYFTATSANPADELGYGTWAKWGEGRAIVGHTSDVSSGSPDWTKTIGGGAGEYTHPISISEVPSHYFSIPQAAVGAVATGSTTDAARQGVSTGGGQNTNTNTIGGNVPINIVQPSITTAVWRRTG